MTDNEPYWTLAETVVWICTRDLARVSSIADIRSDSTLAEETYRLHTENTRTVVDPPDLNEIRDGAPKANWNVSGSADDQMIERGRDGSVWAIGRRKWEGPLERIPPAEFIGLHIRTIPDGLERGQSIDWLDVQFRRADVMQQWPSGLAMAPALEGQDGEPTAEPRTSTQPHHEPPAKQDEPAPHTAAEIDVTQGDTREAEHDAPRSDVTPPLAPVNAETTDIEAEYAQRVNDHRVKTGRRPTFKADNEWRKSKGLKRDALRDLRQKNRTDEEKKGGHPPRS